AVAGVLVDRALEPVHLRRDHLEAVVDDAMHFLGVQLLGQRGESGDVAEEYGDLTSLSFERRARSEDLGRQGLRRVGASRRRAARRRGNDRCRRRRRCGRRREVRAAVPAELELRRRLRTALRTATRERRTALTAEPHARRIFEPALLARHRLLLLLPG